MAVRPPFSAHDKKAAWQGRPSGEGRSVPAIRIRQGSRGAQTGLHGTGIRQAPSGDEQGPDRGRGEGLPPYEELPSQAAPADGKGPFPDRQGAGKEADGIPRDRKGVRDVMEAHGIEEGLLPPGEVLYGPEDARRKEDRQGA